MTCSPRSNLNTCVLYVCNIANILQFKTMILINVTHIQMLRKIVVVFLDYHKPATTTVVTTTTTAPKSTTKKTTEATTGEGSLGED